MDATTLSLLDRIFQTVFPLTAIVAVGFIYARRHAPDMALPNKLNLDIFIPALIFSVMSAKSFQLADYSQLAIGAGAVVLGSGLLLLPVCKLLHLNLKTFLPPMMYNNSGNLGIPLVVLAFGEQALPAAVVLFIVENTLHFTVGIYTLDHRTRLLSLLTTPIILASAAGIGWSLSGWVLPTALHTFIDMLGQISIPLMLFALGVRMTYVDFGQWRIGLLGALLCPLSGVLMALLAQLVLQLDPVQFGYLLLFGALPPAVLNYMLSEKYQQEPQQVASIVLLGNMASLLFIPLTLAFIL
ncbi:AEC family transporter [Marinobacterium arenosum]|uniref:AEC family transporter n=1 Tax=Marinobacterium arenosum TaxID=2862496 RepID=UPI001C96A859|nr:AEC family transporter [Marinobacterium arenosum]MBY4676023.1 AEC family transporter [Marinobacterium arenosum]